MVGILYANSLNAPFYFDDYSNILSNDAIRFETTDIDQIKKFLHENFTPLRSLSFITFAANYLAGGYHPFGYHVFNVLIHVFNIWLVFFFLFQTLTLPFVRMERKEALFVAGLAVLLWAFHPIQTNVAVYIVQRMASLAALFFLLAFLAYIQGRLSFKKYSIRPYFYFLLSAVFWSASLFCKGNTVFWPLLVLFYDGFFFQGKIYGGKIILILVVILLLTMSIFWGFGGTKLWGAWLREFEWRNFTMKERLLTEARVVFHYLSLLFFPDSGRLTLFYDDYPISRSFFIPWTTGLSLVGLLGIGTGIFLLVFFKKLIYAFGLLWYFINLTVESTFIPLELVFEHRVYLPSIGIFFIISFWIAGFIRSNIKRRQLVVCLLLIFIVFESFGTLLRNGYWSRKPVFYEDALSKTPSSSRVLADLYKVYTELGDSKTARQYMELGLEKKPEDINILVGNFFLLRDMGKIKEAEKILAKIDQLLETGKYYISDVPGINMLANMFYDLEKDYGRVVQYTQYTLKTGPSPSRYFNLGLAYLNLQQPQKALVFFNKIREENPDVARYNFYLGITYRALGHKKEGAGFIAKALRLSPSPSLLKEMNEMMKGQGDKRSKTVFWRSPDAGPFLFAFSLGY